MNRQEGKCWGEYKIFSLFNAQGTQVDISNLGASIINFIVKDREGQQRNIVLGYDTPQEYLQGNVYLGCIVGPWANRIAKGQFLLDGNTVQLEQNEGDNHLHGASSNIGKKRWLLNSLSQNIVSLSLTTKKGEAGYPANIAIHIDYELTNENQLIIQYRAYADQATPVNLTQHSYFNLNGGKQDVLDHRVQISADSFLKVDKTSIPQKKTDVDGTPFDLREPVKLSTIIHSSHQQVADAQGFDHCWCLDGTELKPVASAYDEQSGIMLELATDQLGIQFYTGNHLANEQGRNGQVYTKHVGFCFETQYFPNQVNMTNASQCIYQAGEEYVHQTIYKVSIV